MSNSKNKLVTLITGTRKGIGRYLVDHYTSLNHQVIGCSRGDIDFHYKNYEHFNVDVSNEKEVKGIFSRIRKKHGRLDNLINNAGIASMNHSLLTTISSARKVLDTNVIGTFLFCRESAKLMQKLKYGRIINFTTIATPLKLEGEAIYASSKSAVINLTQILAKEFSSMGITVNAIGPTPIKTDLIKSIPENKIKKLINVQSIKRYGEYKDISNVTDFFLQKESEFITGQIIYLGGI